LARITSFTSAWVDGPIVADRIADEPTGVRLRPAQEVARELVDGVAVGAERPVGPRVLPGLGFVTDEGEQPVAVRQAQREAGAEVADLGGDLERVAHEAKCARKLPAALGDLLDQPHVNRLPQEGMEV
jgi:hypothetical protein